MMTETLKQTQAVMRGGEEVECKVVGLASVEDMRWLVRAVNIHWQMRRVRMRRVRMPRQMRRRASTGKK